MKATFDNVSFTASKITTKYYSTSFSLATKMLHKSIRQDIYNIYGFVRFADEIVDTFHDYNKEVLFNKFETDLYDAINDKISLNPILNAFQFTYHKSGITTDLVAAFMKSMRQDLTKTTYKTNDELQAYIYGSADVVGLMCLKVFVKGNHETYANLEPYAMALGSAFQKVNFLRDLKDDIQELNRVYFPETTINSFTDSTKAELIATIEKDFKQGLIGIKKLPIESRFGVFMAYRYYQKLLKRIKRTPAEKIKTSRVRINNYKKMELLTRSYVKYRLNIIQ